MAFVLVITTAACQSAGGLPQLEGGVELGLRRGAAWTTLTVKPPYAIGPRTNLKMNKGEFTGTIDGGGVRLRLDEEGFSGTGPSGNIAVSVWEGPDLLKIEGSWNGSRVHFEITTAKLSGVIAVFQGRTFDSVFNCQYVLDKVTATGARSGTSICGGLPEETLLEIPSAIHGWLTRAELAVILLALLSSPPFTSMETRAQ